MTADRLSASLPPAETPILVAMGAIAVSRESGTLRTLLGSCIGVAIYDRWQKAAALAHVVLPMSSGEVTQLGKFADTAIPEAIQQLERLCGGVRLRLTAKIAGGANMFATTSSGSTIGQQNVEAVESRLAAHGIVIVGRHLGGTQGRRMAIEVATGKVTIEIVGATPTVL